MLIKPPISSEESSTPLMDLTPLIDMLFILLVFLLLTANAIPLTLPIDLPQTEDQLEHYEGEEPIIISIQDNSELWNIDEQDLSWEDLQAYIISLPEDQELVIQTDKKVEVQRLLQLLSFLSTQPIDVTQVWMEPQ